MICDRCKKSYPLYFQHISGINICEPCFAKQRQNWIRETWWNDFELMYDGSQSDELYEYYLDVLDMIPNEEIEIELDEDDIILDSDDEGSLEDFSLDE